MSRSKRPKRSLSEPEGAWDCSVCTFRNKREAFKCAVCDVRKGTSTRKPRLNQQVVDQQVTVQKIVQQQQAAAIAHASRSSRNGSVAGRKEHGVSASPIPSPGSSQESNLTRSPSTRSLQDSTPAISPSPPSSTGNRSPSATPSGFPPVQGPSSSSPIPSTPGSPHSPEFSVGFNGGKQQKAPRSRARPGGSKGAKNGSAVLKNVDRNSACTLTVTVDGVTVVITDYRLKNGDSNKLHASANGAAASCEPNVDTKD